MRWATLAIFLFIITITVVTIEWRAAVKLLNKWTNKTKKNVNVLDVAKLRFDRYIKDFNKIYNDEEYKRRFDNFKASLMDIARLNKLENNTVFGLTKFSDMSKQEFADRMLQKPMIRSQCTDMYKDCTHSQTNYGPFINEKYRNDTPPSSFDWRKEGVVKPVLNQKLCQGCWAFSIVGVLESMSALTLHDYNSRSIQELLDCSEFTHGCYNGNVVIAMNYICTNNLQIVTEAEYPMTLSMDQICKKPINGFKGRTVKRFERRCNMDEDEMVRTVAQHGPLIAAVDSSNWMNYIGGVITRACTRGVSNHVVQIVGYEGYGGSDAKIPIPYYIVRNSFGEDFGDHGYVKIAIKVNESADIYDICGIADQVTFMDVM